MIELDFDKPLVLIDDEPLVKMVWELSAEEKGISLTVYQRYEDFKKSAEEHSKETQILIDSNLGREGKGEDKISEILSLGFSKVWMCTSADLDEFDKYPGLSGAIDKTPPWEGF